MQHAESGNGKAPGVESELLSGGRLSEQTPPGTSSGLDTDRQPSGLRRWLKTARGQYERVLPYRAWIIAVAHAFVFFAVLCGAYLLRFDFQIPADQFPGMWYNAAWLVPLKLVTFYLLRQYQGWWRYVLFSDLVALIKATALASLIAAALSFFITPLNMPRGILIYDAVLTLLALGGLRVCWRVFHEQMSARLDRRPRRNALLMIDQADDSLLANHIHQQSDYRVRGFVHSNHGLVGRVLGGRRVLGNVIDTVHLAHKSGAADVVVPIGTLEGPVLRQLMSECEAAGIGIKIIPPLSDVLRQGGRQLPIRPVEINDLLRRQPVKLEDPGLDKMVRGRRVLVTGAGGSIGSELCRQLVHYSPESLILVDKSENGLFFIERELAEMQQSLGPSNNYCLKPVVADVTDPPRIRRVFENHRPQLILHAAAHKHVPLMEANVAEAIRNNVLGTRIVADLADEFGVERFVFISTDKAVNPTSVMGATKHIGERYVHSLSDHSKTRFLSVRFGNVLGSNGSVVPIFVEQIRRGGPVTVTHPEMTRYFMTIPEACQLVLQAAAMGNGGEIFVLDMGQPVKIVDLAHDLIRLSGLKPESIEIVYTGLRPGEKLYEELYFSEEQSLATSNPKVRAAYHRPYEADEVSRAISDLEAMIEAPDDELRAALKQLVPEYQCEPVAKSRKLQATVPK